ncbi:MAG: adaptor protein MecA [Lachnospiraceae bacterium]|nr:adaptor protein MecA [Lachnospiraceae bacterium]
MKIEKISDNQIRCTLTRADLAERQLQLSELAYGTEKAKSLFHDMMQQAAFEFGFEANDMPLMIEAIPSSQGSIVLVITKVDDPSELDSKFPGFAPSNKDDATAEETPNKLEGAETLMDLLNELKGRMTQKSEEVTQENTTEGSASDDVDIKDTDIEDVEIEDVDIEDTSPIMKIRLFSFATMDNVLLAARLLNTMYTGSNTLYKDQAEDLFILALSQSEHSANDFNRICNMLTEYGTSEKASGVILAFLEEHCDVLIEDNAIQQLATI